MQTACQEVRVSGVRFAQLEPTTRCNFTCGFCCGRQMPQEDLAWDQFVATVDALPDLTHVELQGEGESLLHPRFHDMVAWLRQRSIKVSFISNGSLLSERHIASLLEAGVEKISVSIESPDPDDFRRIRGGKLEKVIRNLEALMAARRAASLDRPVVGFSVTVLASTRKQLPAIYALYRRLGLDGGITLQPLQAMDSYARHYDDTVAREELDAAAADGIFARFFSDRQLRRIQAERSPVRGFYEELMDGWKPGERTCPYLEQGLYVNRTGHVTACCMIKDTDRHGLGRIGETPLPDMLSRREAMRAELAAGGVPEPCAGCSLVRFARMGRGELMWFGLRGLWQAAVG
jgi:MoaA/NifB/PqqE/SkfB family radical SAM enzyme